MHDDLLRMVHSHKHEKNLKRVWRLHERGLRDVVIKSRVFRMDAQFSEYLGTLSSLPFSVSNLRRHEALDSIRYSAKLPFENVFIQYDNTALKRGLVDVVAPDPYPEFGKDEGAASAIGFLCFNEFEDDCVVTCLPMITTDVGYPVALPFKYQYSTWDVDALAFGRLASALGRSVTDREKRDSEILGVLGMLAHGVPGYESPHILALENTDITNGQRMVPVQFKKQIIPCPAVMVEFSGILRHLMVFLATLNDSPVRYEEVRTAKGFLGRGRIRQFVSASVVHLQIPGKLSIKRLAAKVIGIVRRKGHPVRGHWRVYAKAGARTCANRTVHEWTPTIEGRANCSRCEAKRTWIADYETGTELGINIPSYVVEKGAV